MKTILVVAFSIIVFNCFAQENLQFSKAFFITIHSDKIVNFIAKDTIITVPEGKVWNITNSKAFMVYDFTVLHDRLYLFLDEAIITFSNFRDIPSSTPIWLPAGKHRLTIRFSNKEVPGGRFDFQAFITGVEYNVPK